MTTVSQAARLPLAERIRQPGPKRLLALDGGGLRGLLTIEILARLEELLRNAMGDVNLVLADFFDYVGGTSTGAVIATCISLGLPIDRIREFYLEGAEAMCKPAPFFRQLYYRHLGTGISERIQKVLRHEERGDRLLGDPDLRTLLLAVMRNATTDSPWPVSNNPFAKYNQRDRDDCNLNVPLWQLIRASTAAPIFFPPQDIPIGKHVFTFVDGAVTVYNNPSFILFLMATLPEYRLEWEMGEDKLLLVSVGTGVLGDDAKKLEASQMTVLYNLKAIPSALIDAASVEQDLLCRVLGRCRFGERIDRELHDLIVTDAKAAESGLGPFGPKKFTYVRYNPDLTGKGLRALGFEDMRPQDVQRLDSAKFLPQLMAVGSVYARGLALADFGPYFDPTPAS
jgi:hypothetical protein